MARTRRRREASPACCSRGQRKSGGGDALAAPPLVSAFLLLLSNQIDKLLLINHLVAIHTSCGSESVGGVDDGKKRMERASNGRSLLKE